MAGEGGGLSGRDGIWASSQRMSRCGVSEHKEHFFCLDGAPKHAVVLTGTHLIDHATCLVVCTMGESIY